MCADLPPGAGLVNEETGLAGAALAAVYGYFIYYNVALMTETFFIVSVPFFSLLELLLAENRPYADGCCLV